MAQAPIAITHLGSGICSSRRVIRSAILVETVPRTSLTSACRGEAVKKPAPKRSRSLWAMPVLIISMAQHARPNCSGQSEFLRAQLKSLSVLVVSMFGSLNCCITPLKGPLLPGVNESDRQDQDKDNHLDKTVEAEIPVDDGPRVEKRRLHVEDQEEQRENVVAHREGPPRVRHGSLPGLVDLVLRAGAPPRGEQPRQHQRRGHKARYQQHEDSRVKEGHPERSDE